MIFPQRPDIDVATERIDGIIKRSFYFDFETGAFEVNSGVVRETTQIEAIRQWLELLCRTCLDKYLVYRDTGFGNTAESFIGQRLLPSGYVEAELEREITEAAMQMNPAILRLKDFRVERTTRSLLISFTAELKDKSLLEVRTYI